MNLVQINERLKDLPMQVIQQYANGMNPEVPPYLALGELQRRELSQKQMATAQGAQQGPQPSVKEQVEQKAGLMALQQMQQQQMAQQQAMPRGPMPAPAGVPQPEQQPEMMARGGLAGIPVRRDMFEYADGGIVAFQSGGDVDSARKRAKAARDKLMSYGLAQRKNDPDGFEAAKQEAEAAASTLRAVEAGYAKEMGASGMDRPVQVTGMPQAPAHPTPKANEVGTRRYSSGPDYIGYDLPSRFEPPTVGNVFYDKEGVLQGRPKRMSDEIFNRERQEKARTEQLPTNQGPGDRFAPRYPQSGLPAVAKAKAAPTVAAQPPAPPRPTAQAPAAMPPAAPAGLPAAAQSVNPYEDRLNELALKQPVAPTTQDAISRVSELSPAAMQEAALQKRNQEMRDRAAAYKEQFEKSRPSGLDDLIRVFGQSSQYKGLSGVAPAYTANKQQQRAEELAMTKQYNELMNLADTKEYEGGKELFKARTGAFDTAQQLFGKEKDNVVKATASLYETTQSRINNELKMLTDKEIQNLRMVQETKMKEMDIGQRERERKSLNARDPNALVAQYVGLKAKARELREQGKTAEADRLEAQAADMVAFKGGAGNAGVGAGRNAIMERRQTMQELQQIIKDEGMVYTDAQKADAARQYQRLAMQNVQEGEGGAPKVMTQADVLATAKSSGKTPQQVIDAAKARGFTIQ
jgi:hypothetical protein